MRMCRELMRTSEIGTLASAFCEQGALRDSQVAQRGFVLRNLTISPLVVFGEQAESTMAERDPNPMDHDRELQADPELKLSEGRASIGSMLLSAIVSIAIVVVVLFAVTREEPVSQQAPSAQATSTAPPSGQEPKQNQNAQQGAPPPASQANQQAGGQQPAPARQQAGPSQSNATAPANSASGTKNEPTTTGAAPPPAPQTSPDPNQAGPQKK